MIVCICNNVSDRDIRDEVRHAGVTTMPQLRDCLAVGTCCGKCHPHAKQVLRECLADAATDAEMTSISLRRVPENFEPLAA